MAGSYEHCTTENGDFRKDPDDFFCMIENLGDAYEALEEMHFMINFLGNESEIKKAYDAFIQTKKNE